MMILLSPLGRERLRRADSITRAPGSPHTTRCRAPEADGGFIILDNPPKWYILMTLQNQRADLTVFTMSCHRIPESGERELFMKGDQ